MWLFILLLWLCLCYHTLLSMYSSYCMSIQKGMIRSNIGIGFWRWCIYNLSDIRLHNNQDYAVWPIDFWLLVEILPILSNVCIKICSLVADHSLLFHCCALDLLCYFKTKEFPQQFVLYGVLPVDKLGRAPSGLPYCIQMVPYCFYKQRICWNFILFYVATLVSLR